MDPETEAVATVIGLRVKEHRHGRGWTLDQLAEVARVSRRMVISVEQGTVNPSVGTLLRISDALGIGLPDLVQPAAPATVTVVRKGQGAQLWRSGTGGSGILLAGTRPPDVMELWDWHLAAQDTHRSEPHAPGTKEILHVLQGEIALTVADQQFVLRSGDAASFDADVPHTYANTRARPARMSLAVFEPGVGAT